MASKRLPKRQSKRSTGGKGGGTSKAKPTPAQSKATAKLIAATGRKIQAARKSVAKDTKKAAKLGREAKRTGKQLKSTAKSLKSLAKSIKKIVTKKPLRLADYERLLGEDFTSLRQARAAYARETSPTKPKLRGGSKPPTKPTPKPPTKSTPKKGAAKPAKSASKRTKPTKPAAPVAPKKFDSRQRIYEMRDLPEAKQNTFLNGTFEDILEVAPEYNDLLRPGEVFGARIGVGTRSGYTYETFSNIQQLIDALSRYRVFDEFGDDPTAYDDLLGMIKIIRYKAPGKGVTQYDSARSWSARKRAEVGRRRERYELKVAKQKAKDKIIKQAKAEVKRLKKQNAKLQSIFDTNERIVSRIAEHRIMEEARAKALATKLAKEKAKAKRKK